MKNRKIKKLENYVDIYKIFKILYSEDKTVAFLDSSLKNKFGKYSIIGAKQYLELKENNNKFYVNNIEHMGNFEDYLKKFLKENSNKT